GPTHERLTAAPGSVFHAGVQREARAALQVVAFWRLRLHEDEQLRAGLEAVAYAGRDRVDARPAVGAHRGEVGHAPVKSFAYVRCEVRSSALEDPERHAHG